MASKPWEILSNRILEALEAGVAPWRRPWNSPPAALALPANALSHRPYRGINTLLLHMTQFFVGYPTAQWLTFRQARSVGGHVRAGEKATPIAFWKLLQNADEGDDSEATAKQFPFLRLYYVFNVAQCELPEGVVPPLPAAPEPTFTAAARVLPSMKNPPELVHIASGSACYIPSQDRIQMPLATQFRSEGHYWAVLFHELTHASGHTSRLDRKGGDRFGDEAYAREELCAEIGAAMLCQNTGIALPEIDQDAHAYIAHWLKALRNDTRLIISAAQAAQRAVDHILGSAAGETLPAVDDIAAAA